MKRSAVIIIYLILQCLGSEGQQLEGEWRGYYLVDNVSFRKTEIFITIDKINNITIEGYSTTIIKNDTSISILKGGFLRKKKIYLEETGFTRNFSDKIENVCLQKFELFYRENKKGITLNGNFTTKTCGSGTVFLTKRL
jgi:hypothetical protein